MKYNYNFVEYFKNLIFFNNFSRLFIIFIVFKGLKFGIDFKGGTLIEIRLDNKDIKVSSLRDNLKRLNLGDTSVKKFWQ